MKMITALLSTGAILALAGCNPSTSGGPGTAAPESDQPMMGQPDNTFSLSAPMMATKLVQGDTRTFPVSIERGSDFKQEVTLTFEDVPQGVSIAPNKPVIRSMDEKVDITVRASDNAAVGDFTVRIAGRPGTGSEATTEMAVSVSAREATNISAVKFNSWQAERDAYIDAQRKELAAMDAKYQTLKDRAESAEGPSKVALETQLAKAEHNLDAAEQNLEAMEDASPDRWDTMKTGFSAAMEDLKGMFQ